jgi:hypothetical protein
MRERCQENGFTVLFDPIRIVPADQMRVVFSIWAFSGTKTFPRVWWAEEEGLVSQAWAVRSRVFRVASRPSLHFSRNVKSTEIDEITHSCYSRNADGPRRQNRATWAGAPRVAGPQSSAHCRPRPVMEVPLNRSRHTRPRRVRQRLPPKKVIIFLSNLGQVCRSLRQDQGGQRWHVVPSRPHLSAPS